MSRRSGAAALALAALGLPASRGAESSGRTPTPEQLLYQQREVRLRQSSPPRSLLSAAE